jgi:hypothetical protein
MDECTRNRYACSAKATCTNNVGSFTFACNAGYFGDGVTCQAEDVDECTRDWDDCHAKATCTNDVGSFTCACNSGYSGDGVRCQTTSARPPAPATLVTLRRALELHCLAVNDANEVCVAAADGAVLGLVQLLTKGSAAAQGKGQRKGKAKGKKGKGKSKGSKGRGRGKGGKKG